MRLNGRFYGSMSIFMRIRLQIMSTGGTMDAADRPRRNAVDYMATRFRVINKNRLKIFKIYHIEQK